MYKLLLKGEAPLQCHQGAIGKPDPSSALHKVVWTHVMGITFLKSTLHIRSPDIMIHSQFILQDSCGSLRLSFAGPAGWGETLSGRERRAGCAQATPVPVFSCMLCCLKSRRGSVMLHLKHETLTEQKIQQERIAEGRVCLS